MYQKPVVIVLGTFRDLTQVGGSNWWGDPFSIRSPDGCRVFTCPDRQGGGMATGLGRS